MLSPFNHAIGLPQGFRSTEERRSEVKRWLGLRPECAAVNGKTVFDTCIYGTALVCSKDGVVSEQLEKKPRKK